VLDIDLVGAKCLTYPSHLSGQVFPYVQFKLGEQQAKSKMVPSSSSPFWNESLALCLSSLKDILTIKGTRECMIGVVGVMCVCVCVCVCACVCVCVRGRCKRGRVTQAMLHDRRYSADAMDAGGR
jgi:C2 domain